MIKFAMGNKVTEFLEKVFFYKVITSYYNFKK